MDSLLKYASVEQNCNACGGSYTVTLLDALMQHRVKDEWQSPRPCAACAGASSDFAQAIPAELLEQLEDAWLAVRDSARAKGFVLNFGVPEQASAGSTA